MKKIYIISILLLFLKVSYSQEIGQIEVNFDEFNIKTKKEGYKEAKNKIKEGDDFFVFNTPGYLIKALNCYLEAYKYNSENPELNYKIGYCYLNTLYKRKSLDYIEKAYKLKPLISVDIKFFLAEAYQINYMFEEASKFFTEFKNKASNELSMKYGSTSIKKITECKNGQSFFENVGNVMIQNISAVNSEYSDYCPLISADESVLIFTSRRPGSFGGKISEDDGMYFEDIYISKNINDLWTTPVNAGEPLNTNDHDATVGLSPDGQKLFIYRDLDIYVSEMQGNLWSKPRRLPKTINTKDYTENSACFSPDGKTIYFIRGKTGDPQTSNGDIYFSNLNGEEWGEAQKLSSKINTKYDEDGVFIHPDGRTMYFSSKGHNSMGGYDIFKTEKNDNGTWTEPENLGMPINSPDDDIYFVMAADGRTGYYSSVQPDGKGATDLYKLVVVSLDKPLTISTEDNLIACLTNPVSETNVGEALEIKKVYLTIVKGTITDGNSGQVLEAEIQITDNSTGKEVMTFNSNAATGKYLVSLPSGKNYGMNVKAPDYLFHSENFDIPKVERFQEIIKDVQLFNFKKGSKVVLRNVFFDTDKFILRPESNTELNRLVTILKEHADLRIEISGHTDSQGSYDHNVTLSKNRAAAVVDYLIANGINKSRLESRGASWDEPYSTNSTSDGRQLNRRVEFKIL